MKIARRQRKKARIEIIPMIDTMFFLLVFFMVATLSMTMQRGIPVNLPHASTAQEELHQVVTLTLTREGKLLFDKEPMASLGEIAARLTRWKATGTDVYVVINADRAVEHGQVVELMDAVRGSGVSRIAVAVKPRQQAAER
jgi:biopolymer transport protein ExbD